MGRRVVLIRPFATASNNATQEHVSENPPECILGHGQTDGQLRAAVALAWLTPSITSVPGNLMDILFVS